MLQLILIIIIIILSIVMPLDCRTRKPAVSGRWYSSNPVQLRKDIEGYLQNVNLTEEQKKIEPLGIMVPHAGYMFSAPVAAWSYKLIEGKNYDTVIIIGSSHHYSKGIVSVYDGDSLETPLGLIPVDKEMAAQIIAGNKKIYCDESIHLSEHSNEAQLPFLQYMLEDFKVVSILTSTNDHKLLKETADIIYQAIKTSGKKILLINSTDMSHYHSYENANSIDQETISLILDEDWSTLQYKISSRECELCGYLAFEIFQSVLEKLGCGKPQLLRHANSGDAHPEYGLDEVVGYGAIVFPRGDSETGKQKPEQSGLALEDKEWLLSMARQSITDSLEGRGTGIPIPENRLMHEKRAVFVTLHKKGELRGCIGHMVARDALYRAVWEMARSAAFEDPRFSRVGKKELEDINIEISILTPMQKISSIDEIVMGRDGVMVKQGYRSGVFLPQVATETGWDKETFLRHLCSSKAMLAPDAYLDPRTEIYIFQVEEFSE